MRKLCLTLLFLTILAGVGTLSLQILATKSFDRLLDWVEQSAKEHGVLLRDSQMRLVNVHWPQSLLAEGFSSQLIAQENNAPASIYSLKIEEIQLKILGFNQVQWTARNAKLTALNQEVVPERQFRQLNQFDIDHLTFVSKMNWLNVLSIQEQCQLIAKNLILLFKEGQTLVPVELTGELAFKVQNRSLRVPVQLELIDGLNVLAIQDADRKVLASHFSESLPIAEQQIVFGHPLQIPGLFRIREFAREQSLKSHEENYSVPQKVYEHILWGYWITRTYGEDLAGELIEARAVNPDLEKEIREMDQNNSSVGQNYALEEIPEHLVIDRIFEDPDVMISPVSMN